MWEGGGPSYKQYLQDTAQCFVVVETTDCYQHTVDCIRSTAQDAKTDRRRIPALGRKK